MRETWPYWLAGRAVEPNHDLEVRDKYTGEVAARVARADADAVARALDAAEAARRPMAELPAYRRREVLEHCMRRFAERAPELADVLCVEAGKPVRDARGEVSRLIDTFRVAAEEATRVGGEVMPLDVTPRAQGYRGMWKRVPAGVCAFITPFNFPLNLAAHKVAPAIAAGCPFVLKPASATPLGALIIGEVLAECDLPPGAFSILPMRGADAAPLVEDPRIRHLSFTGSPEVGWALRARVRHARVTLELGGNAACVVDADWDVEDAVSRIVVGAFYQSGQSCISVQRIMVHESLYDAFRDRLVEATRALRAGDPHDEETFVGPLIDVGEAERVERWIAEAVERGGRVLCGGRRDGAVVEATLLENVPRDASVCAREVFGPVAVLSPWSNFDAVLEEVDDSAYGLQAGIFTRRLDRAMAAWDRLEVGGVVVGDIPSWRVDPMPYGGVKRSGLGREGLRFAIEELTEIRLLVIRTPPVGGTRR